MLALERQRQTDLWVQVQPDLYSETLSFCLFGWLVLFSQIQELLEFKKFYLVENKNSSTTQWIGTWKGSCFSLQFSKLQVHLTDTVAPEFFFLHDQPTSWTSTPEKIKHFLIYHVAVNFPQNLHLSGTQWWDVWKSTAPQSILEGTSRQGSISTFLSNQEAISNHYEKRYIKETK